MGLNLTQKIIQSHLVEGKMQIGEEIGLKIDQTLTQDSTGTMTYLQFEAMGIKKVKTKKSVAYIDHNMLQQGFENADDHKYIQTVANKHGIYFSKPGNGICHQVHLERFGVPGETLLGSDSHTPTGGGIGMLAIGAGGLDVAVAMGGGTYYINMPKVVNIELVGQLKPYVSAKDVILEVLRLLTVKGGVGKIIEYSGEGIMTLTVPERATITNMGAELGATTSLFPSDEITRVFLKAQKREADYKVLEADQDCTYDEKYQIDLGSLQPMAALPHSPDNIQIINTLEEPVKVDQVAIGSCTNGSYLDFMKVANILKGNTIHPDVSLVISPGSKQVLTMLAENGALGDIIQAGARVLEAGCGPCIGMGQSPASNGVSLRTFNRNFKGRCGTKSASVYLVSPETAAISAITGYLTNPSTIEKTQEIPSPEVFLVNDNLIIPPADNEEAVVVIKGPNIKDFPINTQMPEYITGKVLIRVGDNITTDHIMPSDAKLLPYRSNIPYLSDYCLTPCDTSFPIRAKKYQGGFIVGGDNYGQGSSREHAALVPLYLGVKAVLAKSFARIHKANLINAGILPLVFANEQDYNAIEVEDCLRIDSCQEQLEKDIIQVFNESKQRSYKMIAALTDKEKAMLLAGGKINLMKQLANA